MGLIRMGPPADLIKKLTQTYQIDNFVETGTFYAETAIWASKYFRKVFTIEYSRDLYEKAINKFNRIDNVEFNWGDSRGELRNIVEKLNGSSVFWLDAHWSGGLTYGKNDQCPLIEEINILNCSKSENFIFIDDARLFTSPPQHPLRLDQWPNIVKVIDVLCSNNSERYIVIIEDVIISVPEFAKNIVAEYCQDINAKAWEEYGKQIKTSNFQKGIELIYSDLKSGILKVRNKFLK